MFKTIVSWVKGIIASEPARFYAYGGVVLLAAASQVAKALGVVLPPEVVTGIQAIGVFVATELIRHFVTPA